MFAVARRVIDAAGLSTQSVRYYASLVDYYTVYKLKRMSTEMVHLYLLCFIHDRYQRLNDNLLSAFCALVSRYADEATAAAKKPFIGIGLKRTTTSRRAPKYSSSFWTRVFPTRRHLPR